MTTTLRLVLLLTVALQQTPTLPEVRQQLEGIRDQLNGVIEAITGLPPDDALQAALNRGGTVTLTAGAIYAADGPYTASVAGTIVRGNGATLHSVSGPGLVVRGSNVQVSDLTVLSDWNGAVIECGTNEATQNRRALMPTGVRFTNVTVPTHRGKRGFEINCSATLTNTRVTNLWDDDRQDSQAIAILNTCGPVSVLGGYFEAGSEILLVGGDTLKITDCPDRVQADLTIDGATFNRPDSWRTDGVVRAVKNILELKGGTRVRIRNSRFSGSWKATAGPTQEGAAFTITPRGGLSITDVAIETCVIERVALGLHVLGFDNNTTLPTPISTTNLVVRDSRFTIHGGTYNGRGLFAMLINGVRAMRIEGVTATITGSAMVIVDSQTPTGPFTMTGSTMNTGQYAVMAPGVNYGGPTPLAYAARPFTSVFTGNTFINAPSRFQGFYPNNTFLTQ